MPCVKRFVVFLAACGGASGPPVTATTTFTVTEFTGANPSPLDPLKDQQISIKVVFPTIDVARGDETDTADCISTVISSFPADRTASGPSAEVVQTQILDMLAYWDIKLQLCNMNGQSTIVLHSEIDPLNLAFGCYGIPAEAYVRSSGYPELTTFTATHCSATILDVVNNRVLGNPDFSIDFVTNEDQVP
jgi:hypothetical protein